ncbi:hypothetical protein BKA64DRAFT_415285 [Cadophora sp. MPI-SDFR-AT-0126]|nr:hypothetical protein BKA64DRAFT_415285 [Leotiomycetes sp. MPI-SDFR-AT-0126]
MIDRMHILLHLLSNLASCRHAALVEIQPLAFAVLIGGLTQPIELGGVQCEPASQPHAFEPVPLIQEFTHRNPHTGVGRICKAVLGRGGAHLPYIRCPICRRGTSCKPRNRCAIIGSLASLI